MIKNSRLRWFGHVELKDDNDWIKRYITWEVEGIRQRGRPKKTWWDCVKNDMESLVLSQKDAHICHIHVIHINYTSLHIIKQRPRGRINSDVISWGST